MARLSLELVYAPLSPRDRIFPILSRKKYLKNLNYYFLIKFSKIVVSLNRGCFLMENIYFFKISNFRYLKVKSRNVFLIVQIMYFSSCETHP